MAITIISLLVGVLGLTASILGFYFTYLSYINPLIRFNKLLKNTGEWEKIFTDEQHYTIFRHKKYPGYQITADWDRPVVEDFQEDWVADYADTRHNASFFVKLEVNNIFLQKHLFVSLDGARYFVPVPERELIEGTTQYFYNHTQVQLAKIIGEYDMERNIETFARSQRIPIQITEKQKSWYNWYEKTI